MHSLCVIELLAQWCWKSMRNKEKNSLIKRYRQIHTNRHGEPLRISLIFQTIQVLLLSIELLYELHLNKKLEQLNLK